MLITDGIPLSISRENNTLEVDDSAALSHAFFAHLYRLQSSATNALENHKRTRREVESRETALVSNIAKMVSDCETCVTAVGQIQSRLNEATEANLQLISKDLQNARDTLTERQEEVKNVMAELSRIGQQLSMLAMNAKIEASRAGKSEAGFSVVADEVKRLAKAAVQHHSQAANMFDLTSVNELMVKAVDSFQQSHSVTEKEIGNAFGEIRGAISHVNTSLTEVSEHHGIISEVTQANMVAVEAAYGKIEWTRERAKIASEGYAKSASLEHSRQLKGLLTLDGIKYEKSSDKYSDIKSRGVIRVAIEPDFVGLSFRQSGSSQLSGLDVEYASALAKHLGVRCEFLEAPWDTLTELLYIGCRPNEAPADIVLSALPPSSTYDGIAYSNTYTYLNWVLARRTGNTDINELGDLQGKTLGIINDPGAFELLENIGVRWQSNKDVAGGKIFLKDLIAYSDQSRIHDCLAEGLVDAFGVDLPIYHWASSNKKSPWYGKIEICTGNIPSAPYYYCIAVAAVPASYKLLKEINVFINDFTASKARADIEKTWQGNVIKSTLSYRDEIGNLIGESELRHMWEAHQRQHNAVNR